MRISQTKIERTYIEHRERAKFYRENNKSGVNTKAAEYHRGYAAAMDDILRGHFYQE